MRGPFRIRWLEMKWAGPATFSCPKRAEGGFFSYSPSWRRLFFRRDLGLRVADNGASPFRALENVSHVRRPCSALRRAYDRQAPARPGPCNFAVREEASTMRKNNISRLGWDPQHVGGIRSTSIIYRHHLRRSRTRRVFSDLRFFCTPVRQNACGTCSG